ncbi:Tubulin binding cofactor A [Apiospora kogelbergensis]|uniref:Tubulin-specific chaperone A n=1 Tax=Apiospora kogelbergensis TaxID=1337665 RepID=A0AAW0QVX0_9PEZI
MPAPSPLKIATDAVTRLTKEEKMYQKELISQKSRVEKLEADLKNGIGNEDGNAEFMVRQEQKAMEETKAVFGPLKTRIGEAVSRLEEQVASAEGDSNASAAELTKARELLASTPKDDA